MRQGKNPRWPPHRNEVAMKLFVGFGYNARDQWIEDQVFPILRGMAFTIVDGKDMHGDILQPAVQARIDQSDLVIGFLTLRADRAQDAFNSHQWVRDELVYALGRKPIIPVKEDVVQMPAGLLGDRQCIPLRQDDRLGCVVELVRALGRRNIRRLRLDPDTDDLRRQLQRWRREPGFAVRYKTLNENQEESEPRHGRLEQINQAFYLNVSDVAVRSMIEVEGLLNGATQFSSGWVSADAVQVPIS
jgi:hypothetical protein